MSWFTHTLDWSLVDSQLSKLDRFLALECCVQRWLIRSNLRVGSGVAEISVCVKTFRERRRPLANVSRCEAPRAQVATKTPQFTHIKGCAEMETRGTRQTPRPKLVGRITALGGETPSRGTAQGQV